MSTDSISNAPAQDTGWTTLSNAHVDPSLRDQNPIYERSGSASQTFEPQADPLKAVERAAQNISETERRRDAENRLSREAFMASRRDSEMVKRQRPRPELKPSPRLSNPVLAMAFDCEWANEAHAARHAQNHANATTKQHLALLSKEHFKLRRQSEEAGERELQRKLEDRSR